MAIQLNGLVHNQTLSFAEALDMARRELEEEGRGIASVSTRIGAMKASHVQGVSFAEADDTERRVMERQAQARRQGELEAAGMSFADACHAVEVEAMTRDLAVGAYPSTRGRVFARLAALRIMHESPGMSFQEAETIRDLQQTAISYSDADPYQQAQRERVDHWIAVRKAAHQKRR